MSIHSFFRLRQLTAAVAVFCMSLQPLSAAAAAEAATPNKFRVRIEGLRVTGAAAGYLKVSPTGYDFGVHPPGSTTSATVSIQNTGDTAVVVHGVASSSPFSSSSNCPSSLDAGALCTATVLFQPGAVGSFSGSLSVSSSLGTATSALTGIAQNASAAVSLSPASVAFPNIDVGAVSNPQFVTITNSGSANVGISSVSIAGDPTNFIMSHTCGPVLAAGSSCSASVTFAPLAAGDKQGALTVAMPIGNQTSALTGKGLQGRADLSALALTFPTTQVATTSAYQPITVRNSGNAPLQFSGISIAAGATDFAQSNDCSTVTVGATCTVNVSFTPVAVGERSGTLSLVHNAGGLTNVSLSGTGQALSATLGLSHSDNGDTQELQVEVGSADSKGQFTLTNTGNTPALDLQVPSSIPTYWNVFNSTCSNSLAPGASCTFNVTFAPGAQGVFEGQLTVATSTGTATPGYHLIGTGTPPPWYLFNAPNGRIWYRDMSAMRTVAAAVTSCQQLNYRGAAWRMPSITEATELRNQLSQAGALMTHQTNGGDYVMSNTVAATNFRWLTLSSGATTLKPAATTGYAYCVRDN